MQGAGGMLSEKNTQQQLHGELQQVPSLLLLFFLKRDPRCHFDKLSCARFLARMVTKAENSIPS